LNADVRWSDRAWVAPWIGLLLLYAWWGWLDPAHWTLDEVTVEAALQHRNGQESPRTGFAHQRPPFRPAPPWPDERAIRQRLSWLRLRTLGFKLGPQRSGASEVRVDLQWQGRWVDGLEMMQVLALQWPQMRLDALVLQAQQGGEWRFDWRGWWRHLTPPVDAPVSMAADRGFTHLADHRVFDAVGFQRAQFELWQPRGGRLVLKWLQPDQLQWVAGWRGREVIAWVMWQQHTVALRVGDAVGPHGGKVRSISPHEIIIDEGGRVHRIQPLQPAWTVPGSQP
jgi:hypothetical protein